MLDQEFQNFSDSYVVIEKSSLILLVKSEILPVLLEKTKIFRINFMFFRTEFETAFTELETSIPDDDEAKSRILKFREIMFRKSFLINDLENPELILENVNGLPRLGPTVKDEIKVANIIQILNTNRRTIIITENEKLREIVQEIPKSKLQYNTFRLHNSLQFINPFFRICFFKPYLMRKFHYHKIAERIPRNKEEIEFHYKMVIHYTIEIEISEEIKKEIDRDLRNSQQNNLTTYSSRFTWDAYICHISNDIDKCRQLIGKLGVDGLSLITEDEISDFGVNVLQSKDEIQSRSRYILLGFSNAFLENDQKRSESLAFLNAELSLGLKSRVIPIYLEKNIDRNKIPLLLLDRDPVLLNSEFDIQKLRLKLLNSKRLTDYFLAKTDNN